MARIRKSRKKYYEYYAKWIKAYKLGTVRNVTYGKYELVARKLKELAPDLMLNDVTRQDVQAIVNKYGQTHELQTTIDFFRLLKASLRDAVYEGYIRKDPTYRVKAHSQVQHKKAPKWLEADEVERLEKVFDKDTRGYGIFFDFMLRTGVRFAEAFGITPDDIDLKDQTIDINKTLDYKGTTNNKFVMTKNSYSVRKIKLDNQALADLLQASRNCEHNDSVWEYYYVTHIYPKWFLSKDDYQLGHPAICNSTFNGALARMCKKAGVHRISVHGLRHTHASLLIAGGVSIQSVAARLGHANTTTTQRVYIHLINELKEKDDKKIMAALGKVG